MRLDEAIRAAGANGTIERLEASSGTLQPRRFELCGTSLYFSAADALATDWRVVPPDPPKPREWTLHEKTFHAGECLEGYCLKWPEYTTLPGIRVREVLE